MQLRCSTQAKKAWFISSALSLQQQQLLTMVEQNKWYQPDNG